MGIDVPKVNHQFQIDEFKVWVPWGHVACKWWGSKSIRPIICIHGWQDNAGTFDRLIPHLPNRLSYLVIELPGHGLSSAIPHGMIYTYATFLYVLLLVTKKFEWKRVSLLGHSLGALVSYIFASTFPDRCDMVVSLDTIKPNLATETFDRIFLISSMEGFHVADIRNQKNSEPPSYTYDELIEKRLSNNQFPINIESAPFLMYRGVRQSKGDRKKYYFSTDSRLKEFRVMIAAKVFDDMGKKIVSPFCFIKARHAFPESKYSQMIANLRSNPKFEYHLVDGGHHVHLDNPRAIGPAISKFINTYRPLESKL